MSQLTPKQHRDKMRAEGRTPLGMWLTKSAGDALLVLKQRFPEWNTTDIVCLALKAMEARTKCPDTEALKEASK